MIEEVKINPVFVAGAGSGRQAGVITSAPAFIKSKVK